jgi:hypothetical protein
MEYAVANQEDIMMCERCGGLKVLEHFYGSSTDVSRGCMAACGA